MNLASRGNSFFRPANSARILINESWASLTPALDFTGIQGETITTKMVEELGLPVHWGFLEWAYTRWKCLRMDPE